MDEKIQFQVGDLVRGTDSPFGGYNITNINMTLGEVVRVGYGTINLKILEHSDSAHVGREFYGLKPECFELVSTNDDADFEPATEKEFQALLRFDFPEEVKRGV